MTKPALSLTGTIKSQDDLREQYKNSSNLAARMAIYRFLPKGTPWAVWVFDRMLESFLANAAVLEIGCGPGTLWKKNLERVPTMWDVLLTDLMPGMIDEARGGLESDTRFRLAVMDAQKLDLPDSRLDGVVANHMLYHVPDLAKSIAEIHRVLRPGGKLLAATNGEEHLRRMNELIYEFVGGEAPIFDKKPFSLESGEGHLKTQFHRVELLDLQNELRITEADAVVNYVLSAGSDAKKKSSVEILRDFIKSSIPKSNRSARSS